MFTLCLYLLSRIIISCHPRIKQSIIINNNRNVQCQTRPSKTFKYTQCKFIDNLFKTAQISQELIYRQHNIINCHQPVGLNRALNAVRRALEPDDGSRAVCDEGRIRVPPITCTCSSLLIFSVLSSPARFQDELLPPLACLFQKLA